MINARLVRLKDPFEGINQVIVRYPGDDVLIQLDKITGESVFAATLAAFTGFSPQAASRISNRDAEAIFAAARELVDGSP